MKKIIAIGGVLSALLVGCQQQTATDIPTPAYWDEGSAAYDRGDYSTALDKWRMVGMQGYAGAQYNLGLMFDAGLGVTQNYVQAAIWYRKAAAQGHAGAQYNLGVMYANGQGVPRDYVEAVRWYRTAARQGHAGAQYNLGLMYSVALGMPGDNVQAHMWLSLAEAQGEKQAAQNRDIVARSMTPAQITEAKRRAAKWRPRR